MNFINRNHELNQIFNSQFYCTKCNLDISNSSSNKSRYIIETSFTTKWSNGYNETPVITRPAETNYGARGRPNMGLLYLHLYFNATINLNFVVNSILNRRDIMQYLHNVGKIVKIR